MSGNVVEALIGVVVLVVAEIRLTQASINIEQLLGKFVFGAGEAGPEPTPRVRGDLGGGAGGGHDGGERDSRGR